VPNLSITIRNFFIAAGGTSLATNTLFRAADDPETEFVCVVVNAGEVAHEVRPSAHSNLII
jgi:hypothetical protein